MSAEFTTDYDDQTNWNVIEDMERNIGYYGDTFQYVQEIQEAYNGFTEGRVELQRMIRAAQLITGRKAGDFSQEVQSVYHGELLGIELVNTLQANTGMPYKMDFAQSFMKYRLEKDRPKDGPLVESSLELEARHARLSRALQVVLTPSPDNPQLNPLYERFAERASAQLTDDIEQQYLTLMGFRMIVTEALGLTAHENGYKYSDRHMRDIGVESIREYWQDITSVRKNLLRHYQRLEVPTDFLTSNRQDNIETIDRFAKQQLEDFNERHKLLKENDLISVYGDLFAISRPEDIEPFTLRYDQQTEIKGVFDSIQIVDVPSPRHLNHTIINPEETAGNDTKKYVSSLAIRLRNPVFTCSSDKGNATYTAIGQSVDIPLVYKNVVYHRIFLNKLEYDA
jgi:hypothetical protein